MPRAVEALVGNYELECVVVCLERPHGRNGDDALHSQLLEAMNVGAKIEFAGQDAMAAPVTRQKRHFATFENAADIGIRRCAKRCFHPYLFYLVQPRHRIKAAPADDSNLRLCHSSSRELCYAEPRIYKTF